MLYIMQLKGTSIIDIPVAVMSDVVTNTVTSLSNTPPNISRQTLIVPSFPSVTVKGCPVGKPISTTVK